MSSDTYILAQVCATLCDGPLPTRELVKRLASRGVEVERGELQRVLSNAGRSVAGLAANADHGWSFDSAATGAADAPRTRLDRFVHQLAYHYRRLDEGHEPSDAEMVTLSNLAGQFAAAEVAQLALHCEQARVRRAAGTVPCPIAPAVLAVGSAPHSIAARDATTSASSTEPVLARPAKAKPPKRKQDPMTVKAERRDDGMRVERWCDASGSVSLEIPAKIKVEQLGGDADGVVYLMLCDMPAAPEHFAFAKDLVKARGGKYSARKWRFAAPLGRQVIGELASEGYEIEHGPLELDAPIYDALRAKLLGPEGYRPDLHPIVSIVPTGFFIEVSATERVPCTLGEAMLLDEAGWTFSADAAARIRAIRDAARS